MKKKSMNMTKVNNETETIGKMMKILLMNRRLYNLLSNFKTKISWNWKRLKRGCKEIIEAISESAEMNPKEFIKGLGLEVDEDFGVDLT
jgi:hypothetical protein